MTQRHAKSQIGHVLLKLTFPSYTWYGKHMKNTVRGYQSQSQQTLLLLQQAETTSEII